jgi:hypothetical protein
MATPRSAVAFLIRFAPSASIHCALRACSTVAEVVAVLGRSALVVAAADQADAAWLRWAAGMD